MDFIKTELNLIIGDGDLCYQFNQNYKKIKKLYMEHKLNDTEFINAIQTLRQQIIVLYNSTFLSEIKEIVESIKVSMKLKEEHAKTLKEELKRKNRCELKENNA